MADITLPEPPVVRQNEHTCWAAAAEAWISANRSLNGSGSAAQSTQAPLTAQRIIAIFRSAHALEAHDRLSPEFWGLLTEFLGMNLTIENPGRVTAARLADWLRDGYLYVTGRRRHHHVSHVVVVYGVQDNVVFFMEPLFGELRQLTVGRFVGGFEVMGVGRPLASRAPTNPFAGMPARTGASPQPTSDPLFPAGSPRYMPSPGRGR